MIKVQFKCKDKICIGCGKSFEQKTHPEREQKFCSVSCNRNDFIKKSIGENNINWMGDQVTYVNLHMFVRRRLNQPSHCPCCGTKTAKMDLANISQEYKRELSDWEWLCRKCHMRKDGRLKSFTARIIKEGHNYRRRKP